MNVVIQPGPRRVSVGTDPGLALHTRKGTGYYNVPSLKGAWSAGFTCTMDPPQVSKRCLIRRVLKLTAAAREQLIAFLRTL